MVLVINDLTIEFLSSVFFSLFLAYTFTVFTVLISNIIDAICLF